VNDEPRVIRALPLIRRRADGGWERLKIGGSFTSPPTYEPYTFDLAAWMERQRRAAKARAKELSNGE